MTTEAPTEKLLFNENISRSKRVTMSSLKQRPSNFYEEKIPLKRQVMRLKTEYLTFIPVNSIFVRVILIFIKLKANNSLQTCYPFFLRTKPDVR